MQTLTDKEYQRLRDASVAIIREMGVECGGSNVQMAVNPVDGEVHTLILLLFTSVSMKTLFWPLVRLGPFLTCLVCKLSMLTMS